MATIGARYELVRSLGRGGMGEVFLAQDGVLRRKVAIKRIRPGEASEPVAVERLVREARSAAIVQHPNVVAVHDLLSEGGQTYVVMEYVDAPTLADLIRTEGRLSPDQVAHLGGQIADALAAAHRAGVVHRDVKPSNIMVDASGRAKLADFGVARSTGDAGLTGTGNMIGSIAYMAPEVARGSEAGPASDVYSLGATLFAALEGHSPYAVAGEQSTSVRLLVRLVTESAPACAHGGPIGQLIDTMLSGDPAARPTAAEVQRTLVASVSSAVAAVPEATPVEAEAKPAEPESEDSLVTRLRGRSDQRPVAEVLDTDAEDDRTRLRAPVTPTPAEVPPLTSATLGIMATRVESDTPSGASPGPALAPTKTAPASLSTAAAGPSKSAVAAHAVARRRPQGVLAAVGAGLAAVGIGVIVAMGVSSQATSNSATSATNSASEPRPSADETSVSEVEPDPPSFDLASYSTALLGQDCSGRGLESVEAIVGDGQVEVYVYLKSKLKDSQSVEVYFWTNGDDTYDYLADSFTSGGNLSKQSGAEAGNFEPNVDGSYVSFSLPLTRLKPKLPLRMSIGLWQEDKGTVFCDGSDWEGPAFLME